MAEDTARMVAAHAPLGGSLVIDVGAGPRQYADVFVRHGCRYVAVDRDPDALSPAGIPGASALVASGTELPVAPGHVDVALSSNVFEHVPDPERLGDELVRVVRPGGLVVVSYTNWLSPWGGHETSPFHYLGGERAIRRYTRKYGHLPKNRVGENLFRTSVAQGLRWARANPDAELLEARPRYYPRWCHGLVRVPLAREFLTWNLWMVLRKR